MPLTAEGFVPETLEEIREGIVEELKEEFGPNVLADDGGALLGNLVGIISERLALLNEAAEAVYSSQDPDKAVGQALVALCALTGTLPEEAASSTVTLTMTGTASTVVPAGKVVSVETTEVRFATTEEATLAAVSAWASSTGYTLGQRVKNGGNVYQCITAGTSAGSGGPTTEEDDITDNTVHWRFLGAGDAADDVAAEAEETGALPAASGTLTVIETPVTGWYGAINLLDATLGQSADNDTTLRPRRENELRGDGNSTHEAIRTAVLAVDDVISVTVFANETHLENSDGMPPHSIEVLVRGGDDDEIRQAIYDSKAEGILAHGTESGTVTGSDGRDHTIAFSRPEEIEIHVELDVLVDPETFPEDGDDQIKEAIVAWGDARSNGKDAVASAVGAQAFTVDGVLDADPVYIDDDPGPSTSTTIPITLRQLAVYDTSRITVNVTEGTP